MAITPRLGYSRRRRARSVQAQSAVHNDVRLAHRAILISSSVRFHDVSESDGFVCHFIDPEPGGNPALRFAEILSLKCNIGGLCTMRAQVDKSQGTGV